MGTDPFITANEMLQGLGVDRNGVPVKMASALPSALKLNLRRAFRIVDEQDSVTRYIWNNIPCDLSSQEIERMLYYKGQLILFYSKELEKFFILPYTMVNKGGSGLDAYNRPVYVRPIPFNGTEDDKKKTPLQAYFATLELKVLYSIPLDPITDPWNYCVIIKDYTPQLSNYVEPRYNIQEPMLDLMSDIPCYARTALMLGTGVKGVRVQDTDQAQVTKASLDVNNAALSGNPWIPITGSLEFQEIAGDATGKVEDYLMSLQSFDNLRMGMLGIDSGGLFQKKSHMLNAEAEMNQSPIGLVLQDGINNRKNACIIANILWQIGIGCEISETLSMIDMNGDGVISYDRNMGENSGVEGGNNNGDNEQSQENEDL